MADPVFENGKWWIDKDPDDKRYYYADVSKELTSSSTTATACDAVVGGVTVIEPPVVQGSVMKVKLGGGDTTTGADNFCTFRVTCQNTEQFDKTIWFRLVDN